MKGDDVPKIDNIPEPDTEASDDVRVEAYASFNALTPAYITIMRGAIGFRFGPFTGAQAGTIMQQCVTEKIPAVMAMQCGPEFDWELARDFRGYPPGQGPDAATHTAVATKYVLAMPGEPAREGECLMPRNPTKAQVEAIVCPLLGTDTVEHVWIDAAAGIEDPASMFVDEMGHQKCLAHNDIATGRYRQSRRIGAVAFIVGPAVIFDRDIWN